MRMLRSAMMCALLAGAVVLVPPVSVAPAAESASAPQTAALTTQPLVTVEKFEAADQPLKTDGATGETAEWLKQFDHKPERFACTLELIRDEEEIRIYRLTYPSPVQSPWPENNVVPAELYVPKKAAGPVPAAVVLDILHGSAIIPRGMCRGLAEQGVAALHMPMPCYGARRPPGSPHYRLFRDDPNKAIDNVRQTVTDVRRAKAALAARPEVDPQRIALTGVSLGGIMTSLAAGVDGGFYRVVPILAGGDLAAITFHARETRLMRAAMIGKGMDRAAAEKLLAPVEPLHFASRIDPRTCLMINAARDEVIPKATTEALNKAIGSPQILWAPCGHYSAALYLPNIRQRTIDFIRGEKVEKLAF